MTRKIAILLSLLLVAACDQQRAPDPRQTANPDKYARDREACRVQVSEYMRGRRDIEDSRRDVFNTSDQMGRTQLPDQMANYGDTRTYDKMMGSCMEQRGWSQPRQEWWQKIGQPHAL